ncbi:AIPR family protein [Acinetobacter calcoaceticus]|uniref:AIPR family protein n=1 Tax=Acinetobacter calcoaceticus TaxID=471 RepID=UPI00300BED02
MDVQEFRKDFLEDVKADAAITGEGSTASFVSAFAYYLQEADYLSDFNTCFFDGVGKRNRKLRVDGYTYDELDKTMSLIIADYNNCDDERVFGLIQAKQLQDKLIHFVDEAQNTELHRNIEMSLASFDLIDLLREQRKEVRKYQLIIFTTASISTRLTTLETKDIDGVPAVCQIWDIERLFKVCSSKIGRQIVEVDFKDFYSKGIPCMEASGVVIEEFKSYLCIIPASLLADIYDKYGSALLEGNVRSFLSTKVAVNKKIRTTILQQPERFFAYNNGISATAMNVKIELTQQGLCLVWAKDFQIINGGQTTASLSATRFKDKADLSKIFVQMKLTVIEKTREEEVTGLVQEISRSSNSQNKVSDADFFSTHPFHVRMEKCSKRLFAKATGGSQLDTIWFYERARGQYLQSQMRLSVSEKKKFLLQHPKNQLITKTDFAKVRNTWDGLPHIVSRGAQTNFSVFAQRISDEWNEHDGLFGDRYFQESIGLSIIFKQTQTIVWYLQSYRANVITYTIALLRKLIKKQFLGHDLDLMGIWLRQSVPEVVKNVLDILAKKVYEKLTAPDRVVENVTQWCKREKCWEGVQGIDYILPMEIEKYLIDKEDIKIAVQDAKQDQRILSDAEAQIKVVGIPSSKWIEALSFTSEKQLASPDEIVALRVATQLPKKIPSVIQSKILLTLLEKLYNEGFKL